MSGRTERVISEDLNAPTDRPREQLDVRNLRPPKPLKDTLERLAEHLTDELLAILIQHLDAVKSGDADPEAAAVALELFGED